MSIRENVQQLLAGLPDGVNLVAAVKGRSPEEVLEAIEAGVAIIGENYVQEAEAKYPAIGNRVSWHFIGHLQKNKVRKAVLLFDMIETVDSLELAQEIDKRCYLLNRTMPVMIEVNIAREAQKTGVLPEHAAALIQEVSSLPHIKIMGLMTMGPLVENPEKVRPCYRDMKTLFEHIKALDLPGVNMCYLSMGMSGSYRVAIEEGANMVRIGTKLFGNRS